MSEGKKVGTSKCGWCLTGYPRNDRTISIADRCPSCVANKEAKEKFLEENESIMLWMCLANPYHLCPAENLTLHGCTCICHDSNKGPVPDPQHVIDTYAKFGTAEQIEQLVMPEGVPRPKPRPPVTTYGWPEWPENHPAHAILASAQPAPEQPVPAQESAPEKPRLTLKKRRKPNARQ